MKHFLILFFSFIGLNAFAHNNNTWSDTVANVMYSKCTSCHHEGGIGGFSLLNYEEAYPYRFAIKFAVEEKRMPPWPANPDYREFAHQRVLSDKEIEVIVDWVEDGAPIGDATKIPEPPTYDNEALIKNADFVGQMEEYESKAINNDEYRCFVIPTNFNEDKVVSAIEVIPGNAEIVHHVLLFQDDSGRPEQLDAADEGIGYSSFGGTSSNASTLMAGWVPGNAPAFFPKGMGITLKKGTSLVMQVHYPAGSMGEKDQTEVRLKFTEESNAREVRIAPILNHNQLNEGKLFIPANTERTFTQNYKLNSNFSLLSMLPHMHLIGESITVNATKAGDTINLIDIPQWDFHWQGTYVFPKLMKASAGYSLNVKAMYNNTSSNPNNPNDPPLDVSLGDATGDEMMLVYFYYTTYRVGDENIDQSNLQEEILSTPEEILANNWAFYPNPVKKGDDIKIEGFNGGTKATLQNLAGQVISESRSNKLNTPISVPSGIYLIRIESENKTETKKIVIY
ncbi:MAG: T9SS type A sorting domain-containing protein [Bacteroidia bacterium]